MKSALLTGIRNFEIRNFPAPQITYDHDVKIKIKTVGVCGSDLHYYTTGKIGSQIVKYPFVIGHEAAGIIESIGSKVTKVNIGDRVAIDPAVSCGKCDQCLAGREHTCRKLLFLGCPEQLSGALSEYLIINERCCYIIPEDINYEQATLSEPLAIGVYTVERACLKKNDDVAILGIGPIGLSVFHVLRTQSIGDVFITDKLDYRLKNASKLKPKWFGNPDEQDIVGGITQLAPLQLDCVFECSGNVEAISQAVQLLKPGGKLVITGIPEVDEIAFPIHELRRKEITIINIRRQVNCTQKAIDFLSSGQIKMNDMITHRFALDEVKTAFDLVSDYKENVMKAIITFD